MSNEGMNQARIYDRFRSRDEQIDFLMSEMGQMSLDRQIMKMMKDMEVQEIIEFSSQFFKSGQNQCSSLQTIISNELAKRDKFEEGDDIELIFGQRSEQKNRDEQKFKKVNPLSSILEEIKKIQQVVQETDQLKSIKVQREQNSRQDQERILFEKFKVDHYVPKISQDEDYLTGESLFQQDIHLDANPISSEETHQQSVKIQQQLKEGLKQQTQPLSEQIQEKPQQTQTNLTNTQRVNHFSVSKKQTQMKQQLIEIQNQQDQNTEQFIQSSVPTTIQQNELDFDEIQRIQLSQNKFKITYNNGDQYQGQLQEQMKNGWGEYHYSTGERYEGFFVDDEIQGYGKYFFLSGANYEGDWSSGMKHGIGILKFTNGDFYEGHFVRDLFHGKGTYNYSNGDVFTGIWKEGLKQGKGKFQGIDGSLQLGSWVNDKFQI